MCVFHIECLFNCGIGFRFIFGISNT